MKGITSSEAFNQFKSFIKKHPALIKEVRKQNKSWREIYEEWKILGDDDPVWQKYRQENQNIIKNNQPQDVLKKMVTVFSRLDAEKVNEHLERMNEAISTLQSILYELDDMKQHNHNPPLFIDRKD